MGRSRISAVICLLMGVVAGLGISTSLDWVSRAPAAPQLSEEEMNKALEALEHQSQALAALAAKVKPSVVTVYTVKNGRMGEGGSRPFPFWGFGPRGGTPNQPRQRGGQGSGVIVRVSATNGPCARAILR